MNISPAAAKATPRATPRKRLGQYYTPEPLVKLLLDFTLDPAIEQCPDLLKLRLCDPACGTGHFLIPAAERLAAAISKRSGMSVRDAIRHVVAHQLFGADVDASAIQTCKARLAELADLPTESLSMTIFTGDALQDAFAPGVRFDVVLGNPPYVNAIEGSVSDEAKARLRGRFPTIRGAADLSHYFLARAIELVAPGGRIGLMLPRGVLNAPACAVMRDGLPRTLRPNLLYVPEECGWFSGAAVFACALVLGPEECCRVSQTREIERPDWTIGRIDEANWWLGARRILGHASPAPMISQKRVGDLFEVAGSQTTGDAYESRIAIVDTRDPVGPKLVTTGLIDPGVCEWGNRTCRHLRKDYEHPRIDRTIAMSRSLERRVKQSRRPKVLVAGLTRRVECFVDPGECLGAVSTFSIFHPQDDLTALKWLCDYLLTDEVTHRFIAELGGNGMRGQHVTMKKNFLLNLPLPDALAR